jgi:hypothetical protein
MKLVEYHGRLWLAQNIKGGVKLVQPVPTELNTSEFMERYSKALRQPQRERNNGQGTD